MAESTPFKYRAFLSYSHRDKVWGERLHRALENHRIDKDLVGQLTPAGPVPKTLRPIFRDREDFSAGHSLTAQTRAALDQSQFLIAVCSPDAAKSAYVNEEISHFKAMGRSDRIIPIIVAGTPGDADEECFPPALSFKLGPDGALTSEREEPIAADVRPQGDGRELAKQKVVAGLLGVRLDEVVRRAARAQRRRNRIWSSIAATFLVLAVAATGSAVYAWQQLKTNEAFLDATLDRFTSIVNRAVGAAQTYSLPLRVTLGFLEEAEGMLNVMAQYGRPTPKLRQRQIAMLIAFADNYRDLGRTADAERRIAEAQRLAAELARDDAANPAWRWEQARAHQRRGDLEMTKGDLAAALREFRSVQDIMERLTKLEPNNAQWQRDLSLAAERIGMVQLAQGQFSEAFATFNTVVTLRQRLADAAPGDLSRQLDLTAAYERIGEMQRAQGDLPAALATFRQGLAIAERLIKAAPDNVSFQQSLSIAYTNVGVILYMQGEFAQALDSYKPVLAIVDRLAKADPQNVDWQRHLSIIHERIGDALSAQKNFSEALESYKTLLAIRERIARADPNNAAAQGDLAIGYERLGGIYTYLQRPDEAKTALERALAVYAAALERSPDNAGLMFGSAMPLMRLGLLYDREGIPYLENALAILKQLDADGRLDPRRRPMIATVEAALQELRSPRPAPQ